MKKYIIGGIVILALGSQGCVAALSALTATAAAGVLGGKGCFMHRDAELKEDLQEKTHELNKMKIEMEKK